MGRTASITALQRCLTYSLLASIAGTALTCQPVQAAATPESCESANARCYQDLALPGNAGTLHYYASQAPTVDTFPRQALVVLHGHPRDANRSFEAGLAAARTADRLKDTLVIAPLFQVPVSQAGHCNTPGLPEALPGDATWSCASWLEGGLSDGAHGISSFAALDELVREINRRWPTVEIVTIAGFSAGAQMLQRQIAFAGDAPHGVRLRYVIADPGSWLYFDSLRPQLLSQGKLVDWTACGTPAQFPAGCELRFSSPALNDSSCMEANRWKYGLEALPAHLQPAAATARQHYAAANIYYLEGELDSSRAKGNFYPILDKSCAAALQGPYRLQRGVAYAVYDHQYLNTAGQHTMTIVPGCGHRVGCVMNSAPGRAALFPVP